MNIALAFPACHRRGGIERVVFEAANYLAQRGHCVHLITSEAAPGLNERIRISNVKRGPLATAELLRFRRRAADALRTPPTSVALGAFGVQAPDGGVFWAQSVHAKWIQVSRQHRRGWARLRQQLNPFHPVALYLERRYFTRRMYKRLIALSPDVKQDLIELYNVPSEHIEVLPNGFSPSEFNVEVRATLREQVRAELGYAQSDKLVVFVANELERKGFPPLMHAIAALGRTELKLLVVGRVLPDRYIAEMERLGAVGQIKFLGPTSEVARYYAAADLFALPTEYEAWGLVIIEAMACGLPVLTSRLAGAAVAVREGVTGELLDDPRSVDEIKQKLTRLLDWQPQADPAAISASVQHLAWPNILARYEQILLKYGTA